MINIMANVNSGRKEFIFRTFFYTSTFQSIIRGSQEQNSVQDRSCFEPNKKMDCKYQTCGPKPASRAQQCWASVSISLKAGLSIPFPEAQLKCECYPRKGMNLITTSEGLVTAGLPVECLPQGECCTFWT